jgi:hypothetical protein
MQGVPFAALRPLGTLTSTVGPRNVSRGLHGSLFFPLSQNGALAPSKLKGGRLIADQDTWQVRTVPRRTNQLAMLASLLPFSGEVWGLVGGGMPL